MKLKKVYYEELYKLFKKPTTYALLVSFILPLFYVLSIISNSKHVVVEGNYDAVLFSSVNWNMLAMTGIPELLFALITAHILAYEMERGQLRNVYIRVCDRVKIILAKVASLYTLMLVFYVTYYIFCFALYYIFIVKTNLGNGNIISETSIEFVTMDLIYLIQMVIVSNLVLLFGLYFKAFISFGLGIGVTTTFIVVQFFPKVRYFVPVYIATALSQHMISSGFALILCVMYLVLSFIPIAFAIRKFSRMDIK